MRKLGEEKALLQTRVEKLQDDDDDDRKRQRFPPALVGLVAVDRRLPLLAHSSLTARNE